MRFMQPGKDMVQQLAKAGPIVLCDMRKEETGMKVNKAFSLDPEVVSKLDRYSRSMETWDKKVSRSKIVNDAIRWYLGDTVDLVKQRDALIERLKEANQQLDQRVTESESPGLSWWRRLLLAR